MKTKNSENDNNNKAQSSKKPVISDMKVRPWRRLLTHISPDQVWRHQTDDRGKWLILAQTINTLSTWEVARPGAIYAFLPLTGYICGAPSGAMLTVTVRAKGQSWTGPTSGK
ncbi:hypothetical protein PoB_007448400 [Plakobranchus ocellatus]|uniref:Uncharacterized protein n=1 Tax=Plakobranchus ocellatus TaxID=259542 RepID=A0AAV4DUQ6_9GAST|nr:hypothetical protein PoB_007448400 [Plakobranchus ocellatus]